MADDPRRGEDYEELLGLIALREGNHQTAIEHLSKADLTDVYFKYLLARAQQGAGNLEEARRLFEEVATWNFNSVDFALVRKDAMESLG